MYHSYSYGKSNTYDCQTTSNKNPFGICVLFIWQGYIHSFSIVLLREIWQRQEGVVLIMTWLIFFKETKLFSFHWKYLKIFHTKPMLYEIVCKWFFKKVKILSKAFDYKKLKFQWNWIALNTFQISYIRQNSLIMRFKIFTTFMPQKIFNGN